MRQVIVTGFEPFWPYASNPVEESTRYFHGKIFGDAKVTGIVLPCAYYDAFRMLERTMDEIGPAAVVSTGLASSAKWIRFETLGRNEMNGKYPDCHGKSPNWKEILENGEESLRLNFRKQSSRSGFRRRLNNSAQESILLIFFQSCQYRAFHTIRPSIPKSLRFSPDVSMVFQCGVQRSEIASMERIYLLNNKVLGVDFSKNMCALAIFLSSCKVCERYEIFLAWLSTVS